MSEDTTKPETPFAKAKPLSPLRAFWASLSLGQGVTLAGLFAAVAFIVVSLPPGTFDALLAKDPAELGAFVAAIVLAFGGVFTKAREQ